jgi:Predicted AAA-ATPase
MLAISIFLKGFGQNITGTERGEIQLFISLLAVRIFLEQSLEKVIEDIMRHLAHEYQHTLEATTPATMFEELMRERSKKHAHVVVLIDEYDKPIIDFLDKDPHHIAKANRSVLSNFYGVKYLKGISLDHNLRLKNR